LAWPVDPLTPVLVSLVSAETWPDRARLVWSWGGQLHPLFAIQRRTPATAWQSVGTTEPDGDGSIVYEDLKVVASTRYAYRLALEANGREQVFGETWVEIPPSPSL